MSEFETFESRTTCPGCGEPADRASGPGSRPPKPGDLSICIRCGTLGRYTEHLAVEPVLDVDAPELAEARAFQRIVLDVLRERREQSS